MKALIQTGLFPTLTCSTPPWPLHLPSNGNISLHLGNHTPLHHPLSLGSPPKSSLFKLNTDGASKNSPKLAAAGGIIRDWMGKWIFGFCRNIGHSSSIETELWAMRDGLKLAFDLNLTEIEVEIDATIMQNLILGNFNHCHQLSNLIHDYRYLLDQFRTSTISHTYREGNKCADLLANEGFNHKGEEMQKKMLVVVGEYGRSRDGSKGKLLRSRLPGFEKHEHSQLVEK
ncbi:unnamed protein product [Camellia sinensis]